jgi:hypothetical protein
MQEEHSMPHEKRETVPCDEIQATLSTVFREETGKFTLTLREKEHGRQIRGLAHFTG